MKHPSLRYGSLLLLVAVLALISLLVGRFPTSLHEVTTLCLSILQGKEQGIQSVIGTVIIKIRLPRILAAIIIGAALSASGAAYQGIFRNPLVSPDLLGASAGAGFGAALAIVSSLGFFGTQVLSFLFSLITVSLTYMISTRFKKSDTALILVLTGMLIATLFSSLTSLLKYLADPYEKLPTITLWLMGSLSRVQMKDIQNILFLFVIGLIPLIVLRWRLNVLSFGDEEAQALGVNTTGIRLSVIISATVLTASAVSISGIIGWVGLLIPHIARLIVGPDYRTLLPASIFLGSAYLLLVDTLARTLFPLEIPLGIITSIIGAPIFLLLLSKMKRGWT